jgi:hypothetical protein
VLRALTSPPSLPPLWRALPSPKYEPRPQINSTRGHNRAGEREKLDLELETNPIESAFSQQLVELMNREELAGAQGKWESREQIAAKVDVALASETTRHFTAQSEVNQRRWVALFRHQVIEQQRFGDEIGAQMGDLCRAAGVDPSTKAFAEGAITAAAEKQARLRRQHLERRKEACIRGSGRGGNFGGPSDKGAAADGGANGGKKSSSGGANGSSSSSSSSNSSINARGSGEGSNAGGLSEVAMETLTLEDFAEEERRTWRLAQENMADTERFHIDCAFKLQLQRVDAEWAAHEDQMRVDYEAQKVCVCVCERERERERESVVCRS